MVKFRVIAAGAGTDRASSLSTASVPVLLLPAFAATGLLIARPLGDVTTVLIAAAAAPKGLTRKLSPAAAVPALMLRLRPST